MTDMTTYETNFGYGSQDEMAVEDDHIAAGTFRFIIMTLLALVVAILFAIQWAKVEGVKASLENATWVGTPATQIARAEAIKTLGEYKVIDPDSKTYRIPIERAMALEIEEGGGK